MRTIWAFCVLIFSMLPIVCLADFNKINQLTIDSKASTIDISLFTHQRLKYRSFLLKNPTRLVLDLEQTRGYSLDKSLLSGQSLIQNIRLAEHENNILRIVFDLNSPARATLSLVRTGGAQAYQLKIRLSDFPANPYSVSRPVKYLNVYQAKLVNTKPKPLHLEPKFNRSPDVIIVIDPGHGGHDPGAIGPGRVKEKDVVLAISRDLQRDINRQPGFKAYLTRNGDYYLTLRQRLGIARRYHPDMFLAIHADAYYKDSDAHGASVFALSQRGATSEAARWLAKKENESELIGGVDLSDKNNLLKSVLIDLSQTATIRASLQIGQRIIRALRNVGRLHRHHVEQAAFVVLKSPDIPSLLVETGFISNWQEERKLLSQPYQQKIASAMMQGIRSYFIQQPPPGTELAELSGK